MVLDLSLYSNSIWSTNIYRLHYITLIVVFFANIVYAKEYGTYYLVGQDWTIESGDRVLKCLYRHDMKNKIVTIQYNYPCIPKIVDTIKK